MSPVHVRYSVTHLDPIQSVQWVRSGSETRKSVENGERRFCDENIRGSITRIERRVGQPVCRTVSLTKIYHTGHVKSVTRINTQISPKSSPVQLKYQKELTNIIQGDKSNFKTANLNQNLLLQQNNNHMVTTRRAQPQFNQIKIEQPAIIIKKELPAPASLIMTRYKFEDGMYDENNRNRRIIDARRSQSNYTDEIVQVITPQHQNNQSEQQGQKINDEKQHDA